jgi:hypothetical protein
MQSDDDKETTKGGEVRGGRLEPQPQELDTVILPVTKQRPITEEPGPVGQRRLRGYSTRGPT